MADRDRPQPHQIQVHPQAMGRGGFTQQQGQGVSVGKILVVLLSLPVGGTLLALAGLTLTGSLIGLAVATPLFIICSPVLVPAAIAIGLAVTGFVTSQAFGVTGLTALGWLMSQIRQITGRMPEQLDQAKKRMQDMAGYVGQKTKEATQEIQKKTGQEGGRT
ncbi:Oleosin 5 [Tripterygium wilfordii]|uniref:Oleosin 5 n=1 Tax=Tripterygium wilfordii TaxID=458696 RepID=A0A7J7D248_TRIWF|nr:oleosin 18.2 kDa-like [Tripterygium wilfordii]KAF5740404.1 Oleosin 5 [Tripterygium wilfordii]